MLRLPNPGSDVNGCIRIFQALFTELRNSQPFSFDEITDVLVRHNLATSSGFMGQEALARSTRKDRSRDSFYNQSKAYSEIYRLLGWIHPQPKNKQSFSFTHLGAHAAQAHRDPKALFGECLLRITYPNPFVNAKGDFRLRPFVLILRTMLEMDGILSRDEMIIGPLSLADDQDESLFRAMILRLRSIRGKADRLAKALGQVSDRRAVSEQTMGNYTRLPMSALPGMGWTTKPRLSIYGGRIVFHELTDEGARLARRMESAIDVRAGYVKGLPPQTANAFIKFCFYDMLERAGFDVSKVADEIEAYRVASAKHFTALKSADPPLILFSPFQEILSTELQPLFPAATSSTPAPAAGRSQRVAAAPTTNALKAGVIHTVQVTAQGSKSRARPNKPGLQRLIGEFQAASARHKGDLSKVADFFMDKYKGATQQEFYPLVADMFSVIGFSCEASRAGVNNQRADAFIADSAKSIPVEVKSPTEELHISVKGVRQALENKVILLSRKSAKTTRETSSFVVGYLPPNKRAEVAALVSNIRTTFGIRVGVIDFRSLVTLAAAAILQNRFPDKSQLEDLCGYIDVSNA